MTHCSQEWRRASRQVTDRLSDQAAVYAATHALTRAELSAIYTRYLAALRDAELRGVKA